MSNQQTASYAELQEEIAKLQAQADAKRAEEVSAAVQTVKEMIEAYGLTAQDLGYKVALKAGKAKGTVAVKYRSATGDTWTGRGKQPLWVRAVLAEGRTLEEFAV